MEYVTFNYALNMRIDGDDTPGDWHGPCYDWSAPETAESDSAFFGEWGIGVGVTPAGETVVCANHARACLDLIEAGRYGDARQMRCCYIDDERFTPVIFGMVARLQDRQDWPGVDAFMGREYTMAWLEYKKEAGL